MNPKLKKIIIDKLYMDLSHVEIIQYKGYIWFIDREKKYWYFEFEKSGILWWRWGFFINFFRLFSLEENEFQPIIIEWVEEVLNHKVTTSYDNVNVSLSKVEEVLNHKVLTLVASGGTHKHGVEEVLNYNNNNKLKSNKTDLIKVQ